MSLSEPLISVIVPIYNAEKYLKKCLDSIAWQSYRNLEIILVNDGSTDGSLHICKELQENDARVKIFDRTNHGVGATRNFGLEQSTGDYICFVDSDDYCDPQLFEKLLKPYLSGTELDVSICGIKSVTSNGDIVREYSRPAGYYTGLEYAENILLYEQLSVLCGAPYGKMYRSKLLRGKGLSFDEHATYAEDFIFNMDVLKVSDKYHILEGCFYYYRIDVATSLTNHNRHQLSPEEYWLQRYNAYLAFESAFYKYDLYDANVKEINALLSGSLVGAIRYLFRSRLSHSEKEQFADTIRSDPKVDTCLQYDYDIKKIDRIRLNLFKNRHYGLSALLERVTKIKEQRKYKQ